MKNLPDSKLLEMLKDPNITIRDKAFKIIYKENYKTVERLVTNNSGTSSDAEDIFHEALISLYKQALKGLTLTCKLSTYLYSISKNLWLRQIKVNKRTSPLALTHDQKDKSSNLELNFIEAEGNSILQKCIDQLGEDYRKVLVYFYFEKYSCAKIAQLMNYANAQVVRNKKMESIKKIRTMLLNNKDQQEELRYLLETF